MQSFFFNYKKRGLYFLFFRIIKNIYNSLENLSCLLFRLGPVKISYATWVTAFCRNAPDYPKLGVF